MFYGNYATQIDFEIESIQHWHFRFRSIKTHFRRIHMQACVYVRNPQNSMLNSVFLLYLFFPHFCCRCCGNRKERIERVSTAEKVCKLVCDISDSLPFGEAKPETKAVAGKWCKKKEGIV